MCLPFISVTQSRVGLSLHCGNADSPSCVESSPLLPPKLPGEAGNSPWDKPFWDLPSYPRALAEELVLLCLQVGRWQRGD